MDVRYLGGALWRQKLLVLVILLVTAGAVTAGLWLAPKSYAATATVQVNQDPAAPHSPQELNETRATVAALAGSRDVAVAVQARLADERGVHRGIDELRRSISGQWVVGTILVRVTATDDDPRVAAAIANLAGQELDEIAPPDSGVWFSIEDPAQPPETFSSPEVGLTILLGVVAGLILAMTGAVVRDRRSNTVDDAADAEHAAVAPLLAHLPPPPDPTALPALQPGTAAADRFRHLRTAVETATDSSASNKVVVAGVTAGDFTVWLAANVAIALAGVGKKVLLVDGRMGERFGRPVQDEPDTPGLYDVLTGIPLASAVSPGPVDLLSVLPSGTWGEEPVERLLRTRFDVVMEEAEDAFDVVIVLAPPLDTCDDARVMAVGGSLVLAVPQGRVSSGALRGHADRIRAFGARLLGVVLIGRRAEPMAA